MGKLLFGGLIAVVMLGLYVWSIFEAVAAAKAGKELTSLMSVLFNSIGAMVSATAVALLSATTTGELPAKRTFEKNLTGITQTIAGIMPSIYVLAWVICGVAIVIVAGTMEDNAPSAVAKANAIIAGATPLDGSSIISGDGQLVLSAKTWIGTAITAVYAYFGIQPANGKGGNGGNADGGNGG